MSDSSSSITLDITTGDVATEIFVINSSFQLVTRGIGRLQTSVKPGIYSVKFQSGSTVQEEHILARPSDDHIELKKEPLEITSPIPVPNTRQSREYHQYALAQQVSQTHAQIGSGSSLFVFVRDWIPDDQRVASPEAQHPARGLSLRDQQGNELVDFSAVGTSDLTIDEPWAACGVELNPGAYILSLELSNGSRLEQAVITSAGWQTQIYMLQRLYDEGAESKRANLPNASILIARQQSADIDSEMSRLVEKAKSALLNRRHILSNELREMLREKFESPMLGIYGAHLLLMEDELNRDLFSTVIENLRGLLGTHPDVEALALYLDPTGSRDTFEMPPMLSRSWRHVLQASLENGDVVSADAFSTKVAEHVWGSQLWLQWMNDATLSLSDYEQSADSQFIAEQKAALSQASIERQMQPLALPSRGIGSDRELAVDPYEQTVRELTLSLGLPRAAVEKKLSSQELVEEAVAG